MDATCGTDFEINHCDVIIVYDKNLALQQVLKHLGKYILLSNVQNVLKLPENLRNLKLNL